MQIGSNQNYGAYQTSQVNQVSQMNDQAPEAAEMSDTAAFDGYADGYELDLSPAAFESFKGG